MGNKVLGMFPRIRLDDRKEYLDSGTKEFDRMAFKYLGMALFPLGFGYCIYSVNEFGYSGDMLTQKEGEGEVKDDTETSPAIEDASVEEAEEVVEAVSEESNGDSSNQSSSAWKNSKQKSKKAKKID